MMRVICRSHSRSSISSTCPAPRAGCARVRARGGACACAAARRKTRACRGRGRSETVRSPIAGSLGSNRAAPDASVILRARTRQRTRRAAFGGVGTAPPAPETRKSAHREAAAYPARARASAQGHLAVSLAVSFKQRQTRLFRKRWAPVRSIPACTVTTAGGSAREAAWDVRAPRCCLVRHMPAASGEGHDARCPRGVTVPRSWRRE